MHRMYQGPTSLALDEYETSAPLFEHGAFMRVGGILRISPTGLSAEIWECRLPARFNKAVVTRPQGMAVGTFATGSGDDAAVLLVDICRALATGFAQIVGDEFAQLLSDEGRCAVISESGDPLVVLSSAEPSLLVRTRAAVSEGLLTFEVA